MVGSAVYLSPVISGQGGSNTIPDWPVSASLTCQHLAPPRSKGQFDILVSNMMPATSLASPLNKINDTISKEHTVSTDSVQNNSALQKSSLDPKHALPVQGPQQTLIHSSRSNSPKPNREKRHNHKTSKFIMCHVCHTLVKKEHFTEHLFFGTIQCTKCGLTCDECKMFVSIGFLNSDCHHALEFKSDPFKFILSKVSENSDYGNEELSKSYYVLLNLAKYMKVLRILADKPPWSDAIQKCRSNLSGISCKNKTSKAAFNNGHSTGDEHCLNITKNSLCSERDLNKDYSWNVKMHNKHIVDVDEHDSESDENSTDASEHTLSQAYDLEALDQTIEYVEVASNKTVESKVLYEASKVLQSAKKRTVRETDLDPFVSLPADGKYLILNKSIEDCPLCYTSLCPSRFRVNVESFLVTTVCIGCDLSIYFVVSPNVSIVTDADTVSLSKTVPVSSSKKKKNRSGKRSATRSRRPTKASDFIAK